MFRSIGVALFILTFCPFSFSETTHYTPDKMYQAPKRTSASADVVVEWMEDALECDPEHVCAEGQLYNAGKAPAYNLYLQIEIAGAKLGKPRTSMKRPLEEATMNPGDRQMFQIQLDRKIEYVERNKSRIIEVGKYNYKVIPKWSDTRLVPTEKPPKRTKKGNKS